MIFLPFIIWAVGTLFILFVVSQEDSLIEKPGPWILFWPILVVCYFLKFLKNSFYEMMQMCKEILK